MAAINLPLRELELVQQKMVSTVSGPETPVKKGDAFKQELREIIASTDDIFENLNHSDTELLSNDELIDIAGRLQRLAAKYSELLSKPRSTRPDFTEIYPTIEGQRDRLDSLVETFRIAADPSMKARIRSLIDSAAHEAESPTKTNWREFVGSLHD